MQRDLHVFKFFDEVGKVLAGHADRAFLQNFRLDLLFYRDLSVRRQKGDPVVFRRNFDGFEDRVGRFGAASLHYFHDGIGKFDALADDLHAFPPGKVPPSE